MSNPATRRRGRFAGVVLAATMSLAAVPVAAQASAVNLETAGPFVVLGGASVTNTGPSVLKGDLGVSPGALLEGFGPPAVVNGATHANDEVAAKAQADLAIAHGVAAGQPVSPGNVLTGLNLGGRTLGPGAYSYASSAQLTGALTLDAGGDPNAQFVFEIGSTLTTASASSVVLTNGASPCNVYWQIGSSATLGSGTEFAGNLMAQADITLNSGARVIGRVLAANEITLDDNVIDNTKCTVGPTPPPAETPASGGTTTPGSSPPATGGTTSVDSAKTVTKKRTASEPTREGTATLNGSKRSAGVRATVRGHRVKGVTFTVDGRRVDADGLHSVLVPKVPGKHVIVVHVTFTDGTHAKTMRYRYSVRTPVLNPRRGSSQFTG